MGLRRIIRRFMDGGRGEDDPLLRLSPGNTDQFIVKPKAKADVMTEEQLKKLLTSVGKGGITDEFAARLRDVLGLHEVGINPESLTPEDLKGLNHSDLSPKQMSAKERSHFNVEQADRLDQQLAAIGVRLNLFEDNVHMRDQKLFNRTVRLFTELFKNTLISEEFSFESSPRGLKEKFQELLIEFVEIAHDLRERYGHSGDVLEELERSVLLEMQAEQAQKQ